MSLLNNNASAAFKAFCKATSVQKKVLDQFEHSLVQPESDVEYSLKAP